MPPMQGTDLQRIYNGIITDLLPNTYHLTPKGWRTSFGLTSDNVRCTSHEVKSACQPKGWRTSFGLTSAKLQQIFLLLKRIMKNNMMLWKNLCVMLVTD